MIEGFKGSRGSGINQIFEEMARVFGLRNFDEIFKESYRNDVIPNLTYFASFSKLSIKVDPPSTF